MSAGAILCIVFAVAWLATRNESARRRHERRDFEHLARQTRGRRHMARDLQPTYPAPPVMPTDDVH